MNALAIIVIVVAIVALAVLGFVLWDRRRTQALRSHFGQEFDRAVKQEGSSRRARTVLDLRQKRVSKYQLRPLTAEERDRFTAEWRNIQERFVDDPKDAIAKADHLVSQAVRTRGYPTSDFERQTADLSVYYPHLVGDYRAAHEIVVRSERDQATTEELRLAMQDYRNLFETIVGIGPVIQQEVYR